jgi:CubicO group peptidase (beta-lactamase class C family)
MNKILKRSSVFVILLFLIFISLAVADEQTDRVDKLFAQWDRPDSPGCALAIIENGKIVYERGHGMANLELNISISPKSVFYIGSCSKQFTAMCIALLAKQGKLSLDDDVRKYVPEFPDYGTPISIQHLIHHTSGLRDYLTLLDIAGLPFGYFHKDDVLELLARQKELNFKPGEEFLYSNSGYFLLAIIIERASGKSLREFAEENIFNPLGMKNSHFHDDYTTIINNRASGYFPEAGGKFKNFISTFDCVGSGGLYSTVEDLFLWDQNFYQQKVDDRDLMNLIQTPGTLNNGEKLNYAFGLTIGSYKGLKTVEHGGALEGYRANILRFPEQNFSVICLSNLSSFNPARLCHQVADIYLADLLKEEKPKPKEKPATYEAREIVTQTPEQLSEYQGDYFSEELGVTFKLVLKEGKLYFAHKNAAKSPLSPTLRDRFSVRGFDLNFIRDAENKISAFSLNARRVRNLRFNKK